MKGLILLTLLLGTTIDIVAQNEGFFEGIITYEYQIKNPNSQLISDEEFYRELPNRGKSTYKMYIKGNQYRIDYSNRTEVYQPSSRRVMIYPNDKVEDSFHFVPSDIVDDKIEKIEKTSQTETILSHACQSILTKNKWDSKVFYYNATALKANPAVWKSHLKDDLGPFIAMSSSFPLKIEGKSPFGNYTIKAIKIEKKALTNEVFTQVKGKTFIDEETPAPTENNTPTETEGITK